MCRWLDLSPEHFLRPQDNHAARVVLPVVPSNRRLRWSLKRLYAAADHLRKDQGLTWSGAATAVGYKANQLTALRTAKYATNIDLAMKIVQWANRPSTDFMYLARW